MGYAQVYIESGIPRIWGKFHISKECADNGQELMSGMMYCSKINGIEIDTSVFFVNIAIEDMVKTKFNPGGLVSIYESVESGISPLMVIPKTTQVIEEYNCREEGAAESQGTRTQLVPLQKKSRSKAPPKKLI